MAEITAALTLDAGPAKATTDAFGASAQQAARAVDGLSASQRELVARSEKVAAMANTIDIQNKKTVSSYLQEVAQVRALAQQMGALALVEEQTSRAAAEATSHAAAYAQQMKALKVEAGLAAASQVELGAATGLTKGGLNSLRSSVTSLVASLVGTAPGVAQFTGVLGSMALGSGLMIGVLAGMAALGFAWDKLTEKARKAKEEHQKAIDVLDKLREKQDQGPAGETGVSTAKRTKDLADQIALVRRLEQEQANLAKLGGADVETSGVARRLAAARQEMINLQDLVSRGNKETARLNKEAADQAAQQDATALAERLSFNQKDAAARQAALDVLAKDRAEYARLLKLPNTPDNSAQIAKVASEIKQLDDVLHPKSGRGTSAFAADIAPTRELTAAIRAAEAAIDAYNEARARRAAAVASTEQDLAEAQQLLAAIQQGTDAYEAQQRTLAVLHQLRAEGITQANEEYAAEKKRLEQLYDIRAAINDTEAAQRKAAEDATHEAEQRQREVERRYRDLERGVARSIEQGITDITNGKNPFIALADTLKRTLIRAIADALAQKWTVTIAKVLGIEAPADKQIKAGREMQSAADKQLQAAKWMKEAAGQSVPQPGGTTTVPTTPESAAVQKFKEALKVGGAAYGGYTLGHGVGEATGDKVTGAVGGAIAGATAGAAIGGPVGAAVGGIAGFVGGILGAGDAARKAAAALAAAKKAFDEAFASAQAQANHDALAQQQAQIRSQGDELIRLYTQANVKLIALGLLDKKYRDEYAAGLEKVNALVAELLDQAAKADALAKRNEIEDYRVRILRAQGKDKDADALAFQNQQQRERDQFAATHDPTDPQTLIARAMLLMAQAAERQQFATEQNTKAIDALTTTLHNAPTGFKVEPYTFQFGTPRPLPPAVLPINTLPQPAGPMTPPVNPFVPQLPLASRGTTTATTAPTQTTKQITIAPVFKIDGTKGSRTLAKELAVVFKQIATEALGPNADPSQGLDTLA